MTSESSTGSRERGRPPGGEVGLRQLLDPNRRSGGPEVADPAPPTQPLRTGAARSGVRAGSAPAGNFPTGPTQPLRTRRPGSPPPPRQPGGQPPSGQPGGPASGGRPPRPGPSARWQQRPEPRPAATPWWKSPATKRTGIVVGAVFAVATFCYIADLVSNSGEVPRGVVVAGIDIGGMEPADADAKLRGALGNRANDELPLRIGAEQTSIVPGQAGLTIDWDATWASIGGQPLNPYTRFVSLFGNHSVHVVSKVDAAALDGKLAELHSHDIATVEGTIRFENGKPIGVPPVPGRVIDTAPARAMLIDRWVLGAAMDLPEVPAPLTVRPEAVEKALHEIAEPAVRAPVTFAGKNNTSARLDPAQIASLISFGPDGQGGLRVGYDQNAATALLAPQLVTSEVEPKDASFAMAGGKASVVPAITGDKVNWAKTLEQLPALLVAQDRTAQAVYEKVDPALTTEAAQALGIIEPMGSFTTGGFSGPSGVNIRVVAQKVNGAVVRPGDTFSLNDFTGPRGTAEGYVESGIIDHGRPSTAVGGGISQFATTLYNAAYFAGLEDAGHTEHSYYISRYPAAREATVFDGAIDLKFRNNTPTGLYIETIATGSDITVRIWGTKTVDVESVTGDKSKPTEPNEVTLPKGKDCIAAEGAPGFTISDTRIITDHKSGREVSRHTRTVKYDPVPIVKCE